MPPAATTRPGSGSVRPSPPASAGTPPDRPRPAETGNGTGPREYQATAIPAGKFVEASAAYQIPLTMVRNKSTPVDLWIDASLSPEQLKSQLQAFLQENAPQGAPWVKHQKLGEPDAATDNIRTKGSIRIAKQVSATLKGAKEDDFKIEPMGPEQITARTDMPLTWRWMVTPLRASEEGLRLTLSVVVDPGDGSTPLKPIEETVVIQSDAGWWERLIEFIKQLDPLMKFIAALGAILPLLAGLLAWLCKVLGPKRGICARLRPKQQKAA